MLVENGEIFLLDYHIKRLKESADYFLFFFDEIKILHSISDSIKTLDSDKKYRLRILLSKWGEIKNDVSEITPSQKKSRAF